MVAVQYYREKGILPWAFNNFLALLGWSPGNDQEIFTREELIEQFSLERINTSHSIFNYIKNDPKFFTDPKAISINEHHLRNLDLEELAVYVKEDFEKEGLWKKEYETEKRTWFLETLDLIRPRFHTIKDFADMGRAYFADDFSICEKPLNKNVLKFPELAEWLPQLADKFAKLDVFTAEKAEEVTREMASELDIKPGILINGMRTVITGQLAGPSMFDILMAIGQEKVVERLRSTGNLFK